MSPPLLASSPPAGVLLAAAFAATSVHGAANTDGFHTVNGVTTGGSSGPAVMVTTAQELIYYAGQGDPYTIQISGTIVLEDMVRVESNKTLVGLGNNALLDGMIFISGKSNIIIQNLTVTTERPNRDGVRILGSHHIWVDHCTLVDCSDGMVDISQDSNYVTVSWCEFFYTRNNGHNLVNLVTNETFPSNVTFHHNWWSTLARERIPRCQITNAHVYNNYYDCHDNNYCVRADNGSSVLLENNYFDVVNRPWVMAGTGKLKSSGNIFINADIPAAGGNDAVFTPPYSYSLDATEDVKAIVKAGAGAGKLQQVPTAPVIITHPAGRTVSIGEDVRFSVVATGNPAPSYQWQKGGANINGATSSVLNLASVQSSDAGKYTVFVFNSEGSVTSNAAVLSVNAPAVILRRLTKLPAVR